MVMEELYKLDKVGYIRFASVYRSFQDVSDFRDALARSRDAAGGGQASEAWRRRSFQQGCSLAHEP